MKNVLTAAAVIMTTESNALLNLRDHHLLSTEDKITPFESLAFLEEFDEIPVFGGLELRQSMLEKAAGKAKEHLPILGLELETIPLAKNVQTGIQRMSRHINDMAGSLMYAAPEHLNNSHDQRT